jgi:hypothetical protein
MLRLLASAVAATGAVPSVGFETLVSIVSLKGLLCQFRRSLGQCVAEVAVLAKQQPLSEPEPRSGDKGRATTLNARLAVLEQAQRRRRARLKELEHAVSVYEEVIEAKEELQGDFGSLGTVGVRDAAATTELLAAWPGWGVPLQGPYEGSQTPVEAAAAELARVLRDGDSRLGIVSNA